MPAKHSNRRHERALIVQSDGSLLVDTQASGYQSAREELSAFAQIVKTPGQLHTYRITPVSLWNAAAAGWTPEQVMEVLERHARYGVPESVSERIGEQIKRWGSLILRADEEADGTSESDNRLRLVAKDPDAAEAIARYESLAEVLTASTDEWTWYVRPGDRGNVKQILARLGFPVLDMAGYTDGTPLSINVRTTKMDGSEFALRSYQESAVESFLAAAPGEQVNDRLLNGLGSYGSGGHGVVVLPCGGGKTIVGIGAMARLGMHTLILATGATAVRQWITEILDKTELTAEEVGEYSGQRKQIRPVTVATYQIATRPRHRALFERQDFGFIIYDEVHLLPAPLFRTTAYLQARRRLGMTATLVREDGREAEVFSLIGPKRYEMPWRSLEGSGWVATAQCCEIRVPPTPGLADRVDSAQGQDRYRLAAENKNKDRVVEDLIAIHEGERILVIGQYLDQLRRVASRLRAPILTGDVPQDERDDLYAAFRCGDQPVLVVSRVANFSVDLPDATVCVQVSGLFGSRQEEAQRLGRILRPKSDGRKALFYTLVTVDTPDQHFALARQRFLTEQGYRYSIADWQGKSMDVSALGLEGAV